MVCMDMHTLCYIEAGHYYRFHILSPRTATSVVTNTPRRRMTVTVTGVFILQANTG